MAKDKKSFLLADFEVKVWGDFWHVFGYFIPLQVCFADDFFDFLIFFF